MIKKETVSKGLDSVIYRGGFSIRKPSVVTMAVSHETALAVSRFYEDKKQNLETETGLIRVELSLVYEDGEPEPLESEIVAEDISALEQALGGEGEPSA